MFLLWYLFYIFVFFMLALRILFCFVLVLIYFIFDGIISIAYLSSPYFFFCLFD